MARVLERVVRFDEVDAAGLVFFAHYAAYGHESMEAFFDVLDGGYARLILQRRVGLPAVKVESEFHAPLRYGETVRIETSVARLGKRSAQLRHRFHRGEVLAAEMLHTVVTTDLDRLVSCDMPGDVRAALDAHLERG